MTGMEKVIFVEQLKSRTKQFTLNILQLFKQVQTSPDSQIIRGQIIRAAASVASNYRAACRARSRAEFYSKISIVVEEADESLFWLELLEESNLASEEKVRPLKKEAFEILCITARARKTAQLNKQKK